MHRHGSATPALGRNRHKKARYLSGLSDQARYGNYFLVQGVAVTVQRVKPLPSPLQLTTTFLALSKSAKREPKPKDEWLSTQLKVIRYF